MLNHIKDKANEEIDKLIFHCSATIEGRAPLSHPIKGGGKDRGWVILVITIL